MSRWVLPLIVAAGCGRGVAEGKTTAPRLDDRGRLAYIESVTRCVTDASGVEATIEILDSARVAAYARPGDRVALSRGLLAHLRSEAELDAVTAHELAHLALRHASDEEAEASEPEFGVFGEIFEAAQLAAHSREQEREADSKAVEYLTACGRSAHAMIELFDVLARVDEDDDGNPWFATHPAFDDRSRRLSEHVHAVAPRDPGHGPYVEALAGLVYGEDPRQGFVSGRDYIVPALDVRFALPDAWSSKIEDRTLVSQSPTRGGFLIVERVQPGDGAGRLQAALDAGQLGGGEIHSVLLGATRVTHVRFVLTPLDGILVHLERDAAALVLVGLAPRDDWEAFAGELVAGIESFGPIEDPKLASVQPRRLGVLRLDRAMTLTELAGSAFDIEELARLNGLSPTTVLRRGTVLKIVTPP